MTHSQFALCVNYSHLENYTFVRVTESVNDEKMNSKKERLKI